MNLGSLTRLTLLLALAGGCSSVAVADDRPRPMDKAKAKAISGTDLKILGTLHQQNAMEIEVGKLAARQGTAAIQAYASTLIADHTSNDQDLMALANKRGATIPTPTPSRDAEKAEQKNLERDLARLATLKGADFDTAFLTLEIGGLGTTIAKIDAALSVTSDDDVKNFLTMTKPPLQLHAKRAKDLQATGPKV